MEDIKVRLTADELDLAICSLCTCQTTFSGEGLDLEAEDAEYKCPICLDPRQLILKTGQQWTTLRKLIEADYKTEIVQLVDDVWTIRTVPRLGIGQRAFLLKTEHQLIMWDCIARIDNDILEFVDRLSGGKGITHMVVSHPHYYSTTKVWMSLFPAMILHLAKSDFDWHQRKDLTPDHPRLSLIDAVETRLGDVTVLLLGGHFPGSLVLHWKNTLFIADTIQVVFSGMYKSEQKQREGVATFSFMWSYPNQIPLSVAEIERLCRPLENFRFDRAFGAFDGYDVWGHAKDKVFQSKDIVIKRLQAL